MAFDNDGMPAARKIRKIKGRPIAGSIVTLHYIPIIVGLFTVDTVLAAHRRYPAPWGPSLWPPSATIVSTPPPGGFRNPSLRLEPLSPHRPRWATGVDPHAPRCPGLAPVRLRPSTLPTAHNQPHACVRTSGEAPSPPCSDAARPATESPVSFVSSPLSLSGSYGVYNSIYTRSISTLGLVAHILDDTLKEKGGA